MALKTYKPYTKSTRGTILIDRKNIWKGKPYKPLTSINNPSKRDQLHDEILVLVLPAT